MKQKFKFVWPKVTDFEMARLDGINPEATRFANIMCPGIYVYMPPEAVQLKSTRTGYFSFNC